MQGQPNVKNIMMGTHNLARAHLNLAKEVSCPQKDEFSFEPIQEEGKYFDWFKDSYDENPIEYFSGTVPQVDGFDFTGTGEGGFKQLSTKIINSTEPKAEDYNETLEDRISKEMDQLED